LSIGEVNNIESQFKFRQQVFALVYYVDLYKWLLEGLGAL